MQLGGYLTSVPAEIWLLTNLKKLWVRCGVRSFFASIHRRFQLVGHNLTSLPNEIELLTNLTALAVRDTAPSVRLG